MSRIGNCFFQINQLQLWMVYSRKSLTLPSGRAAFYVSQRGYEELGKRLFIGIRTQRKLMPKSEIETCKVNWACSKWKFFQVSSMSSNFFLLLYFSISVQFGMNMLNNLKQQLSDNCPKYLVAAFIQTPLTLFILEYIPTKEIIYLMNSFLLPVVKNVLKTFPFLLI